MKSRIGHVIIFLLVALASAAAPAQQAQWQETERYSTWLAQARSLFLHTLSVGMELDAAQALIHDAVGGSVPRFKMQREVIVTLARTNSTIDEISNALTGEVVEPRFPDPRNDQAAENVVGYLRTAIDELRAQHQTTQALLTAANAEDWTTYDLKTARSLRLSANSLRSDAAVLVLMMESQDSRTPEHALSRTMAALNEPSAVRLELIATHLDGEPMDLGASYSLAEAAVIGAKVAIENGETAMRSTRWRARAAGSGAASSADSGENKVLIVESFERSFAIERQLLAENTKVLTIMLGQIGKPDPINDDIVEQLTQLAPDIRDSLADRLAEQRLRATDGPSPAVAMQQ